MKYESNWDNFHSHKSYKILSPKWQPFCSGLNMPNAKTWKCKTNSGECMLTTPKRVCTYLHDHRRSSDDWSYKKIRRWFNSFRPSNAIWWHRSGSTLAQVMACYLTALSHYYLNQWWIIIKGVWWYSTESNLPRSVISPLWPSDAIWRYRSGSTLAQVMACCRTAPTHYLNQCWPIISEVQWHSY